MNPDADFLQTLDESQSGAWSQFIDSLHALAAAPDHQIARFPDFVWTAAELADDFDHWYRVARDFVKFPFTPAQLDALNTLAQALESMGDNPDLWTDEALRMRPQWSTLRQLAQAALVTLAHTPRPPAQPGAGTCPGSDLEASAR